MAGDDAAEAAGVEEEDASFADEFVGLIAPAPSTTGIAPTTPRLA